MKTIVILANNRPGEVGQIASLLGDLGINIEEIFASEEGSVIHLTVDHYDAALQALRDARYRAISEDALVIKVADKPGALAKIAKRFEPAAINVRSLHIIRRKEGDVWISLVTSDNARAMELVRDVLA